MEVIFQKACHLHIKRDLRGTGPATRREPARTHMDPLNSTRTLKCGTLLGNELSTSFTYQWFFISYGSLEEYL